MLTSSLVFLSLAATAPVVAKAPAAPQVSFVDIDGERLTLNGTKLLVFADPDQADSISELHQVRKVDAEWFHSNVHVIHVGLGLDETQTRAFARKNNIVWRAVADPKRELATALGVEKAPHVVLVSGNTIAYQNNSYNVARYRALREALATATGVEKPWGETPRALGFIKPLQELHFGRLPSSPGAATRWQPLARVVGEASFMYVTMDTAANYEDFENQLKKRNFHVANVGPVLAHTMRRHYEPLVALQRGDAKSYRGIVFTREQGGVAKLADLRGKRVALVSKQSSSGGVFAVAELLDAGLDPARNVELVWSGGHHAAAEALRDGTVDAAACYEDCRTEVWEHPELDTRLLAVTDRIPMELIIVRKDLPRAVKQRIKRALLAVGEQPTVLKHISKDEQLISAVLPANPSALAHAAKLMRRATRAIASAKTPSTK